MLFHDRLSPLATLLERPSPPFLLVDTKIIFVEQAVQVRGYVLVALGGVETRGASIITSQ